MNTILVILICGILFLVGIYFIWTMKDDRKQNQLYEKELYKMQPKSHAELIEEGVKNGTVKIIQPKYPKFKYLGENILLLPLMLYFTSLLFRIIFQESRCQLIFGFNAQLIGEIIYLFVSLLLMFFIIFWHIKNYLMMRKSKGSFYPPIDKQPWFLENICQIVDDKMIKEPRSLISIFILFYILLYPPNLDIFPLEQTNITYQQQCLIDLNEDKDKETQ